MDNILFGIMITRDGEVYMQGEPLDKDNVVRTAVETLRILADALESGSLNLNKS